MAKYVMALDQGTTSSRCIIFDHQGNIIALARKEFEQIFPKPGWVEHDPMEIWSSQVAVASEAMAKKGIAVEEIAGIGITNQRETTIIWDKETGKPIYNAIVWQCRRSAGLIEQLVKDGLQDYVIKTTGLIPDAYFSASKIAWVLENVPGARELANQGRLLFGTVDTWLIYNLTGRKVHVTDYTNASRTMLFDIKQLCWDKKILEYFKIPESMLPKVKPSSCIYGYTKSGILGGNIPVAGAAGDQQAALFGQCCFEPGEAKNTYGTGCFLLMNTGKKIYHSNHGLITTIAASENEEVNYAIEGSVFVAGALMQWLRDGLRILETTPKSVEYALQVEDTNGVYIVPAFTGLGAPYWDPYAKGTVVGLTRGCTKEHFIRAALESIAYQTNDVLKAMYEDTKITLKTLKVDGGASENDFLMQFQSDISSCNVDRPEVVETTALGAAYLAGLATGFWKDKKDILNNWKLQHQFQPIIDDQKRNELLANWDKAVRFTLKWKEM
ncbi:MAG: glycerol kinase GlpK [Thomasclavelia sp.]